MPIWETTYVMIMLVGIILLIGVVVLFFTNEVLFNYTNAQANISPKRSSRMTGMTMAANNANTTETITMGAIMMDMTMTDVKNITSSIRLSPVTILTTKIGFRNNVRMSPE